MTTYDKQNELLLNNLTKYYSDNDFVQLDKILNILKGESEISLRIIDWFVTNYSKQQYTIKMLTNGKRLKVYDDYKLKLKAYSKKRFDPFCRWERINILYKGNTYIQTTIGQLNFFKWALENEVIDYINNNYTIIEKDMNSRNSTSKRKNVPIISNNQTRKKREELSLYASKNIKNPNKSKILKAQSKPH